MQVFEQGGQCISLDRRHFVAAGGQGAVYARDGFAYKIFSDPAFSVPLAKIRELEVLPEPLFNRPRALLVDASGATVGYVTHYIPDAYILCQLFPRAFRNRENLTHARTLGLVEQLRDGVFTAHRHQIMLVDLNEMNFLVDRRFERVTFIDTDSYKTPGFPACAIMDSVRDRHMSDPLVFDERSDWFSFACVSFQMFTGIHPYKGTHPSVPGLDARMQANVSVLNQAVKLPSSVYDFDVLPTPWRHWYEAVLEHGHRGESPDGPTQVGATQVGRGAPVLHQPASQPTRTRGLRVSTRGVFPGPIHNLWSVAQHLLVATDSGLWLDEKQVVDWPDTRAVLVGRDHVVAFRAGPGASQEVLSVDGHGHVQLTGDVHDPVSHEGRAYSKAGDLIVELQLLDWGRPVVSTLTAVHVLPEATQLFPGVAIQDLLGSCFVSLLLASHRTPQIRLPELDPYRVLDAKWHSAARGGILMVAATRDGRVAHLMFRFSSTFERYDVQCLCDAGPAGLNFIVTGAGVCVRLTDEGELHLSYAEPGRDEVKILTDAFLSGDLRLHSHHGQLLASRDNHLFNLNM